MNVEDTARQVAEKRFGLALKGRIERLPQGRVNQTFLLRTDSGKFILQRLHPVFGRDGRVVENAAALTECLAAAGLPTSRVKPTLSGALWAEARGVWRLTTWLPGRPGRQDPEAGSEAARFLGLFHQALARTPLRLKPLPQADHNRDGPAPAAAWGELMERYRQDPGFGRAGVFLSRGRELAGRLPLIGPVTRAVLHGDPKLDNFLFDEGGRAAGLIDLDSARTGFLIWELADFLRSWAGVRQPNDEMRLAKEIFLAALRSYQTHGLALTEGEWRALPAATRAMALDLARRYLTDYFEESYFAWDQDHYPSLAEQNLKRGAGLIKMAEEM